MKELLDELEDISGPGCLGRDEMKHPRSGMTLLQMALLTPNNENTVEVLLDKGGEALILQRAETSEFSNLTSLYLALLNCEPGTVKSLLGKVSAENKKAFVNERIRGKYDGLPYAELSAASLIWAYAGSQPEDILRKHLLILIDNGLDMSFQNSEGNGLLHLIVLQSIQRPKDQYYKRVIHLVYDDLVGLWYMGKYGKQGETKTTNRHRKLGMRTLLTIKNYDGLTPLELAAAKHSCVVQSLIGLPIIRIPDPKLGMDFRDVSTFNITDIRSLDINWNYMANSVLHQVAHCDVDLSKWGHGTDVVDTEPIETLLKLKWNTYKVYFYGWGLLHLIFMSILSWFGLQWNERVKAAGRPMLANVTDNTTNVTSPPGVGAIRADNTSLWAADIAFTLFFLLIPCIYIALEVKDLCTVWPAKVACIRRWSNATSSGIWAMTGNGWYRVQGFSFSVCVLVWLGLRWGGSPRQEVALSIALVLGWIFVIFFTRALSWPRGVGAFSIMLHQMFINDMIPFLMVSFIVLLGFSTAMQVLVLNVEAKVTPPFNITFFRMFNYFTDNEDKGGYEPAPNQDFSRFLITVYSLITVILMVNMLIAAMNRSYEFIRSTKVNLVARQRLSILLMLERRSPISIRKYSERNFEMHRSNVFVKVDKLRYTNSIESVF